MRAARRTDSGAHSTASSTRHTDRQSSYLQLEGTTTLCRPVLLSLVSILVTSTASRSQRHTFTPIDQIITPDVRCGNRLTSELKIRGTGLPALSMQFPHEGVTKSELLPAPLHFELREQFQIVVRGAIGQLERLNFLIDTGSIPSMVDQRVAKKLGVDVQPFEILAFGQKSHALTTVLPSLRLGPIRADDVTAAVGDLSFLHGLDAIIGLDVLSRSSFRIDYETKQVTFGPLKAREPSVPLEFTPPFLTVQLALAGRPFRLLVDTGSGGLVLFGDRLHDRLPRLPVHGEQVVYHISGTSHLHRVLLPPVKADGMAFEHLDGFISDAPVDSYPPEIDGVLGIRALAVKGAEFDLQRNRLGFR